MVDITLHNFLFHAEKCLLPCGNEHQMLKKTPRDAAQSKHLLRLQNKKKVSIMSAKSVTTEQHTGLDITLSVLIPDIITINNMFIIS